MAPQPSAPSAAVAKQTDKAQTTTCPSQEIRMCIQDTEACVHLSATTGGSRGMLRLDKRRSNSPHLLGLTPGCGMFCGCKQ
jgi:hypothetical protein